METDAQAHAHTHSHREREAYFCVAEYLGVLARDSGLQGREGVWGAAWLTVIGLGVKGRRAEALRETRAGARRRGLATLHFGCFARRVPGEQSGFGTCRSNMLKILDNCKINC